MSDTAGIDRSALLDQSELWIDKEGRIWRIGEMETSHIENLIRWLNRQMAGLPFPNFNGEMAQWYAEREFFALQEGDYPLMEALREELAHRAALEEGDK